MIYIIINLCCYLFFSLLFFYSYPHIKCLTFIDIQFNDKNDKNDKNNNSKINNSKNDILSVRYTQVNYLKSFILMLTSPFVLYTIYCIFYYHYISYSFIVILGSIYAATDMSAIVYNPVCHRSTLIHHISVQILYFYCVYYNWVFYSLASCITLYACFSTLSYLVNFRLSIRESNNPYERIINDLSLCVYSTNSIVNWVVQLYFIIYYFHHFNDHIFFKTIYILLLLMIIYDDIFLIKYLYKNNSLNYYLDSVSGSRER